MASYFIELPPVSGGGGGAVDSVNGQTGVVVLTKSNIGLGNVDNTSDLNKPISTATQTALNAKQDSLGFTPENVANKENTTLDTSTTKYPTNNLVKTYVDQSPFTKMVISDSTQVDISGVLTETLAASFEIPANTFKTNDFFRFMAKLIRVSGTNAVAQIRIRLNTANTLSGATQIAIAQIASGNNTGIIGRNHTILSGVLTGFSFNTSIFLDFAASSTAVSTYSYDVTQSIYLFVTIQPNNAGDTIAYQGFLLTN